MNRIRVVLTRPIYPRNIGMCARAMANMDVDRLFLIAPACEIDEQAKQGAVHAQSILREARTYPTLADYINAEGDGIRIALSGRDGQLHQPRDLDAALASFREDADHPFQRSEIPIDLILGPEDDGLANEEMELCHHVCRLPTLGEITSLNVSHACLLAVYLVQAALGRKSSSAAEPSRGEPNAYPFATIHNWLEALGFDLSSPRVNIEKTLHRLLLSRTPSVEESRILDSVLQQTVRKLRQAKKTGTTPES